jgi:UDP-N-acetylmuramate-alanine ligase
VHYIGSVDNAAEKVIEQLNEGDLCITLGAGSVSKVSDQILEILQKK